MDDIGMGRVQRPDLLGDVLIETLCPSEEKMPELGSDSILTPQLNEKLSEKLEKNKMFASNSIVNEERERESERKLSKCVSYVPISVCSSGVTCLQEKVGIRVRIL
jgi:hypothetical protein